MNLEELKRKAKSLKKEINAVCLACKNPKTPWYAKALAALVVGYALSPVDLIPDFIPVLGYLDDLLIVPLGIKLAIKLIPDEVMEECRENAEDKENKNYIAGALVILIWILIITLIVKKIIGD
ncbi:MAG: DUF1232 domain-containing protein [Bacillota bacterium]|nr:DUF1232 domain-containing protein [Bacillota bacterium]